MNLKETDDWFKAVWTEVRRAHQEGHTRSEEPGVSEQRDGGSRAGTAVRDERNAFGQQTVDLTKDVQEKGELS